MLDDVSFSPRLGNIPRVITLSNNATCHVADNDLIDAFLKTHKRGVGSSVIHLLESRIVYVLAAVLFTVFLPFQFLVFFIIMTIFTSPILMLLFNAIFHSFSGSIRKRAFEKEEHHKNRVAKNRNFLIPLYILTKYV